MANSPKRSSKPPSATPSVITQLQERSSLDFELEFFDQLLLRLPNCPEVLRAQAENHARKGQHRESLLHLQRLQALRPEDAEVLYNLARRYAALRQADLALDTLRQALEQGYTDLRSLLHEAEFESLRRDPRFKALLRQRAESLRRTTTD